MSCTVIRKGQIIWLQGDRHQLRDNTIIQEAAKDRHMSMEIQYVSQKLCQRKDLRHSLRSLCGQAGRCVKTESAH